jgi:hypothetical protein
MAQQQESHRSDADEHELEGSVSQDRSLSEASRGDAVASFRIRRAGALIAIGLVITVPGQIATGLGLYTGFWLTAGRGLPSATWLLGLGALAVLIGVTCAIVGSMRLCANIEHVARTASDRHGGDPR